MATKYNGWANYETWNVTLWIGNDEGLYNVARRCRTYGDFVSSMKELGGEIAYQTPDGVSWNDSGIDEDEIADYWREMRGEDKESDDEGAAS
jgi:hypothetical protein